MAGGGQGMMGGAMGNIISQMKGATQPSQSTVGYTPVTPSVYNNAFNSQQSAQVPQTTQAPSVSPIVQQMAQRIQAQNTPFNSGLQSLYNRFNIPQPMLGQRMPMQMPVYQNPALAYRPNIQAVQQNLSRVKPSVYKTDLDAARARIAELEAAQQPQDTGYNYSGG